MIATDLDGTLLGDDGALAAFREWLGGRRERLRLVYASGRSAAAVGELVAAGRLPEPDAVITDVGTEIHVAGPGGASGWRPWPGWLERFGDWSADRVRLALAGYPGLEAQDPVHQTRRKASYDALQLEARDLASIRQALARHGIAATLVYSAGRFLDVIPPGAGKGPAARFLAEAWSMPARDVLVFGDSGNDADLLASGFRGTLVANALPELDAVVGGDVYRSPLTFAAGVLDGIRFWSGR